MYAAECGLESRGALSGNTAHKRHDPYLISHKVFIKAFLKSQFPYKSVNLSFIITDIQNELTDLRGNYLSQEKILTLSVK